eukprot:4895984-Prymnesium_polylepis.2
MWIAKGCRGDFLCHGVQVSCWWRSTKRHNCTCAVPYYDRTVTPWMREAVDARWPNHTRANLTAALLPRSDAALMGAEADHALAVQRLGHQHGLYFVHSHRQRLPEFELHTELLKLPTARDSWLLRNSSLLLYCNDATATVADLLSFVRLFPQEKLRMLVHTPVNIGYRCGELHSLYMVVHIWSRFAWVLYVKPDTYVTPLGIFRTSTFLANPNHSSYAIFYNRFPNVGRAVQMDCLVFRPQLLLDTRHAESRCPQTVQQIELFRRNESSHVTNA